jgi:hypothetical protein
MIRELCQVVSRTFTKEAEAKSGGVTAKLNRLVMNQLLIALRLNGEEQRKLLETALDLSIRGGNARMELMWKLGRLREALAKGHPSDT